jgi:hypothetical protein
MYSLIIVSVFGVILNTTTTFNYIVNNQCWVENHLLCYENEDIFCILNKEVYNDYSNNFDFTEPYKNNNIISFMNMNENYDYIVFECD